MTKLNTLLAACGALGLGCVAVAAPANAQGMMMHHDHMMHHRMMHHDRMMMMHHDHMMMHHMRHHRMMMMHHRMM